MNEAFTLDDFSNYERQQPLAQTLSVLKKIS